MKLLYADFESYYDREYSLSKMTPIEYVLDARFDLLGCAFAEGDNNPFWLDGKDIPAYLAGLDPENTAIITHNALFDACIFQWNLGFTPRLWIDTMAMARALTFYSAGRVSLAKTASFLGLPAKGDTIKKVIGMNREAMIQAGIWFEFVNYGLNDVTLCRSIFKRLRPRFPMEEFVIDDMVIRAVTEPRFVLDEPLLHRHLALVKSAKETLLDRVGVAKEELMSNDKFALALRRLGVTPPTKISPTTGKETFAFAKTDQGMKDLEEHEDPDVQSLVAARLGFKSTLEETRTERFIKIASLTLPGRGVGWMPVPLRYGGAHTHRFSGDWSLNLQNLANGSPLRAALSAPPGCVVVTVDASQIEARLTAWLADEGGLVKIFAEGRDPYSEFASLVYGVHVPAKNSKEYNKKLHGVMRAFGKICILGLGFGMGPPKFQDTVRVQGQRDGVEPIEFSEAERVVKSVYRGTYRQIVKTWYFLNNMISRMASDPDLDEEWKCVRFQYQKIRLPGGLYLWYDDLRNEGGEWIYEYGGKTKRLYGGKVLENIVQHLDRDQVMAAAIRIKQRTGYDFVNQVHDELVYVIPKGELAEFRQVIQEEMCRRPSWGPDLPLDAEVGVGPNYGEAK